MTQTNGHPDIDELVAREIDEYQESLFGGRTTSSDRSILELPLEAQERIHRAKRCLATLHSMKNTSRNLSSSPVSHPNQHLPEGVGRFEIRDQIGVGGFGVVYRAHDPFTKRDVALKIPRLDAMASEDLRKRFELEAAAAGKLDHPNIVPILEAGTAGPIPYIASVYYDGPDLAKWMHHHPGPTSIRSAADLVRQLALAVENAHKHGVLHRDIKPSNVLLAQIDPTIPAEDLNSYTPKLMDFGLAKIAELAGDVTRTGAILGTCKYMAPEQAEGKHSEITTATDVYALGGLLFELLTGRPAFEGDAPASILFKVIHNDVPDIRTLRKETPLDLAVIIAKCLSKSKVDRYSSAHELADDLDRFLSGIPTKARPVIWWERLWRWSRRRPAQATAAALGVIFPITLLGISLWGNGVLFEKNREISEKNQEILRRLYSADMRSAKNALDDHRVSEARSILAKYEPSAGAKDFRTLAWNLIDVQLTQDPEQEWRCHSTDIYSIGLSPDQRKFVTASRDGTACIWDLKTGKLMHRLSGHQGDVNVARFTPDGRMIVSGGNDGTVRLWMSDSGECIRTIRAHSALVGCLVFSPSGQSFSTGSWDGTIRTWDISSGKEIGKPAHAGGAVADLVYTSDGNTLIATTQKYFVSAINSHTHEEIWSLSVDEGPRSAGRSIALVEGDRKLIVGCEDGSIQSVDMDQHAIVDRQASSTGSGINRILFMPDGESIVVVDQTGRVQFQGIMSNEPGISIHSVRCRVWDACIVENAKALLTASADGVVRRHYVPSSSEVGFRTLDRFESRVNCVAATDDGKTLFAQGSNFLAAIDVTSGRRARFKRGFSSPLRCMALSPDAKLIATGDEVGRTCVWNSTTFNLIADAPRFESPPEIKNKGVDAIRFFPGQSWMIYGCGETGPLVVWDFVANEIVWQTKLEFGDVQTLNFMPDGRMLAGCNRAILGFTRDGNQFREYLRVVPYDVCWLICPLPDNRTFVTSDENCRIARHDAQSGFRQLDRKMATRGWYPIAVSLSGHWMATGSHSGDLCLLNPMSFEVLSTTSFYDAAVTTTTFSKDESMVYAGLSDGRVIAKETRTNPINILTDPSAQFRSLIVSPDGHHVIVIDNTPAMRVFRTTPLQPLFTWASNKFDHASFSPNNADLLLSAENHLFRTSIEKISESPQLVREFDFSVKEIFHLSDNLVVLKDQKESLWLVDLSGVTKDRLIWQDKDASIERMAVSIEAQRIAAATTNKQILIWDLHEPKPKLIPSPDNIRSMVFSPNGHRLAVGTEHGSIRIFDIEKSQWGSPLHHPENKEVTSVAFGDGGDTILSCNGVSGVQLWDTDMGEAIYNIDEDIRVDDVAICPSHAILIIRGVDEKGYGVIKVHSTSRASQ